MLGHEIEDDAWGCKCADARHHNYWGKRDVMFQGPWEVMSGRQGHKIRKALN